MRRVILAGVFAGLMALPSSVWAQLPEEPAPPPASTGFYPSQYLGQGDAFNCPAFASQADAQAVLRADPSDPNGLDIDLDGIACESNRTPKDTVPVTR